MPCFGGSTGCGPSGSIAIPFPLVVVKRSSSVDVVTMLQDTTLTGTVTIKAVVKQGTTTLYSKTTTGLALQPGYVAYGSFPLTLPSTTGAVTVAITVLSSTNTVLAKGGAKFTVN